MRLAIIDCGTNTFHLLIVEKSADGIFKELFKSKANVKLGEKGISRDYISEEPFKRGIEALRRFRKEIDRHQATKIIAFATAAIRNAKNAKEFMHAANEEADISIAVISGEREAELIYHGVRKALDLGDSSSLIMDIGGGSTEFIIANSTTIFWKKSFKLGASLLLEKFQPSDPIQTREIDSMNNYFTETLVPLMDACKQFQPNILIGSSGSFETFSEMILKKMPATSALKDQTSYRFNLQEYINLHQELIRSTLAERREMKGLVHMRIEMIVIASLLLTFVLDKTGISQMKLSTYALKEGMLAELLEKGGILEK